MDYEVFLVSRMREEYVHTRDPLRAITAGFTASARVVTSAAVIMISVFAAFIPHSDMTVKPVALGLAVGVFVDAFMVRMTLVPAVLALLGHRAWWLPKWLDDRLPTLDVEGVGLHDHLEHESWTLDHGTPVVRAEDVSVPGVLDPVSLVVHDPTLVVVASEDAAARTALLGALSGRVDADGRLVVLDRVLPAEGGAVRRQVGLLAGFPSRNQLDHLHQNRLVLVDGVDEFASPDEVAARWATLRTLVCRGRRCRRRRESCDQRTRGRDRRTPCAEPGSGGLAVNRFNRVLAGTLLLPVIFGGLVLWSMGDRTESADRVPAAVVNLDKPVTTGSGKDEQIVAAGRLLAAGLTSPSDKASSSLGWELTDSVDAQAGLENGDYYAVVTIPRDFSKTLARMSGDDPAKAGITLQTNDASSAVIGEASKQVTEIATARLGRTITANYLKGAEEQSGKPSPVSARPPAGPGSCPTGPPRSRTAPASSTVAPRHSRPDSAPFPVARTGWQREAGSSPPARRSCTTAPTGSRTGSVCCPAGRTRCPARPAASRTAPDKSPTGSGRTRRS